MVLFAPDIEDEDESPKKASILSESSALQKLAAPLAKLSKASEKKKARMASALWRMLSCVHGVLDSVDEKLFHIRKGRKFEEGSQEWEDFEKQKARQKIRMLRKRKAEWEIFDNIVSHTENRGRFCSVCFLLSFCNMRGCYGQ